MNAFEVIYQYRSIGFEALDFKEITLKFMLAPFGVSLLVAIAFSCCLCSNSNLEKLSLCFVLMCLVAVVCFASSVYGLQGLVGAILNFKASQMVGEQKGDANQQAWVNSCLPPPYRADMLAVQEIIQPVTVGMMQAVGLCTILMGCPICAVGCFRA